MLRVRYGRACVRVDNAESRGKGTSRITSALTSPQNRKPTFPPGLERTFEAVVNMALFLQREAVRNALQRQKPLNKDTKNDPKQRLAQLVLHCHR